MPQETPFSEEESLARTTIEQASKALSGLRSDIPVDFVTHLFARTVPEDVVHYGPADLAKLGERAWDFLSERQAGAPKIRCETVALAQSGEGKWTVTVGRN